MKTNCCFILATMVAASLVAQVNTNSLPAIPAPVNVSPAPEPVAVVSTNAPVAAKKKAVAKKKVAAKPVKKIYEPVITLNPGPATVLAENLNLRGQAGLKGEFIGHVKKGDTLNVISQINLDKHAPDEPAQWAKVSLPSSFKVWVNAQFIDSATKTVTVRKLNLRAGPGENYSVLGVLEKGATVSELSTKNGWIQIEPPSSAFAFAAAIFLMQESPAPVPAATSAPVVTTAPEPAPTPTPVSEPAPSAAAPTTAPIVSPVPAGPEMETAASTNAAASVVTQTNAAPPVPRIVSHEGYVRGSISPVAPTYYELFDWDSGNAINYLYSPTTNLNLARYDRFKIIVTGEESMAQRWPQTPVLTIQKIYVLETNYPQNFQRVASPRSKDQTIRGTKPQQRR